MTKKSEGIDVNEKKKAMEAEASEAEAKKDAAAEAAVSEQAEEAEENVPVRPSCEQLQADLEKALSDAEDFKKKWYSVSAEYENYRKRTASTRSQAYTEGRSDVIVKLFPIADSLERALAACTDEKTKQGIGMVIKNFEKLLEGEHVTPIVPIGEPFDAARCEAILAVEPKEGEQRGFVNEVYAKGYEQNGKILRFAQVLVTK